MVMEFQTENKFLSMCLHNPWSIPLGLSRSQRIHTRESIQEPTKGNLMVTIKDVAMVFVLGVMVLDTKEDGRMVYVMVKENSLMQQITLSMKESGLMISKKDLEFYKEAFLVQLLSRLTGSKIESMVKEQFKKVGNQLKFYSRMTLLLKRKPNSELLTICTQFSQFLRVLLSLQRL